MNRSHKPWLRVAACVSILAGALAASPSIAAAQADTPPPAEKGTRIPIEIVQEPTDPLVAELFESLKQRGRRIGIGGSGIGNIHRLMANSPKLFAALLQTANALREETTLAPLERELAILCVLTVHGGDYEITPHTLLARRVGATEPQIANVTDPDRPGVYTPRQRAVLRFAQRFAAMPADRAKYEDDNIRAYLDNRQIVELAFTLSSYMGGAHITGVLDVPRETALEKIRAAGPPATGAPK